MSFIQHDRAGQLLAKQLVSPKIISYLSKYLLGEKKFKKSSGHMQLQGLPAVKLAGCSGISDAPGRNKSGFGRARALKIGLRAGSGFHYKNPGGLGLRKSGHGLKCTICPTKFERSRAHEVPSKGGVG